MGNLFRPQGGVDYARHPGFLGGSIYCSATRREGEERKKSYLGLASSVRRQRDGGGGVRDAPLLGDLWTRRTKNNQRKPFYWWRRLVGKNCGPRDQDDRSLAPESEYRAGCRPMQYFVHILLGGRR